MVVRALPTNFDGAIDDALLRRLSARVHFDEPDAAERRELWRRLMPAGARGRGSRLRLRPSLFLVLLEPLARARRQLLVREGGLAGIERHEVHAGGVGAGAVAGALLARGGDQASELRAGLRALLPGACAVEEASCVRP